MLGGERGLVSRTRRVRIDLRGRRRLRWPSRHPVRDKAVGEIRLDCYAIGRKRTSIGWHESPKSASRPFGCTQVARGARSMRRHLSVDLTKLKSF
jgi:hypothetical protein